MLCPLFCTILGTESHILYFIHGENIGLGNHLNPRGSSKCTVFMTGFFTKGLFCMPGENAKFQVLFGKISKESLRGKEHIFNV